MAKSSKKLTLINIIFLLVLHACGQERKRSKDDIQLLVDSFGKSIDYKDSLYVAFTARAYMQANFSTMGYGFGLDSGQTRITVERAFYSPDKLKAIFWVFFEVRGDRECDKRISHNGTALISVRENTHIPWKLYILDNRQVVCYDNKADALWKLGEYYYKLMRDHSMTHVIQSGSHAGELELKSYEYNLTDKLFWKNCWVWEHDFIGSNGLYPFQIKSFGNGFIEDGDKCIKCETEIELPTVNYPKSILKLYD